MSIGCTWQMEASTLSIYKECVWAAIGHWNAKNMELLVGFPDAQNQLSFTIILSLLLTRCLSLQCQKSISVCTSCYHTKHFLDWNTQEDVISHSLKVDGPMASSIKRPPYDFASYVHRHQWLFDEQLLPSGTSRSCQIIKLWTIIFVTPDQKTSGLVHRSQSNQGQNEIVRGMKPSIRNSH